MLLGLNKLMTLRCQSSSTALLLRRCTVSRITERKKALEIRATKRSSVNIVGKMPFCVLEVEKLF